MIRVLLADDDPLIREGLAIVLQIDPDIQVVQAVKNGQEAVEACVGGSIDVAVLDVRMPVKNGVDAAREICRSTNTRVLMLTTFDDDELVHTAIENGAGGYLLKGREPEEIIGAIKMLHSGNRVYQDDVFTKIQNTSASSADLSSCTEREIEVIELIAQGLSNKEIAEKLFLSEGTIKNYISSILSKLELKHRTQIAIYYLS